MLSKSQGRENTSTQYLLEKSAYQWTYAVQTWVVHGSTVVGELSLLVSQLGGLQDITDLACSP